MIQHAQLISKAKSLGVSVTDVSPLMLRPAAILDYRERSELVLEGVPASWTNVRCQYYCDNKQLTKLALMATAIPHPRSVPFQTPGAPELDRFIKKGQSYVCKPLDASNGLGVVMNIRKPDEVKTYFEKHRHLSTIFLLEEQIEGTDLRIQVIDGNMVAACIREPAFVLGNGKDNLQSLIERRKTVMQTQNPNNSLILDENTHALLAAQKIQLSDVPETNRKIKLKSVSNMAQGGVAIDVTDDIHPAFQDWVNALSKYLTTRYFGLDIITADHKKEPKDHSWVLEINARADWLHHTFSERKTHDIAGMILQALFDFD